MDPEGLGWIWMDLDGSGWILMDLDGYLTSEHPYQKASVPIELLLTKSFFKLPSLESDSSVGDSEELGGF